VAAKKTSAKKVEKDLGPTFDVGESCMILRPHLWSGCACVVENVSPENIHRVVIKGKNGHAFHADVPGSQLRFDL